jgi:transposase
MSHANACLTPRGRLKLARCVVEDGWSLRRAAERFQVSVPTAKRWADRYRQLGEAGMLDRSSRPHRCPNRTHRRLEKKIKHLRTTKQLGPVQIAGLLGYADLSSLSRSFRRWTGGAMRSRRRATA